MTLAELEGLHRYEIPAATPQEAPWPPLRSFGTLLEVADARELKGVPVWKRAERRAGHARGRRLAERWAIDLLSLAHRDRAAEQARLDAQWEALLSCERDAVRAVLGEAFRAASAPVTSYDVTGTVIALTIVGPAETDLPTHKPTFGASGAPTTSKLNKGERSSWLAGLTAARVLLAAKQVFASVPGATEVEVLVLSPIEGGRPVLSCVLRRGDVAEASFAADAWSVLHACAPGLEAKFRGRSRELSPIDG